MIADDLFAGAGGWDLGAARLGIHARGVENMPAAVATREAAGLETIHDDVWTFVPDGIAAGLIASPPCQTFSSAGKGKGRKALDDVLAAVRTGAYLDINWLEALAVETDPRTALVLTPLHFALTGGYRWAAFEQVPAVLPVWEACAQVLRRHGWSVWTGNVQAEQYGVPQTRRRALLLASRDHEVTAPVPTHSRYYARDWTRLDDGVKPWVSMAEALGWSDDTAVVSNYGTGGDTTARGVRTGAQPSATVTSKVDRNRVEYLRMTKMPNSAVRTPDQPAPTMAFGHDAASARWFHRRPSTIVGSFCPDVVAAPGYRTTVSRQDAPDSVRITLEQAGVLQSFPADHPWQGPKGKQFLQCGNAVPPVLAMHGLSAATAIPVPVESEVAA